MKTKTKVLFTVALFLVMIPTAFANDEGYKEDKEVMFNKEEFLEREEQEMNRGFFFEGKLDKKNFVILENGEKIKIITRKLRNANIGDTVWIDAYWDIYNFIVQRVCINGVEQKSEFVELINKKIEAINTIEERGYDVVAGNYYKGKIFLDERFDFISEGKEIEMKIDNLKYNGRGVFFLMKEGEIVSKISIYE